MIQFAQPWALLFLLALPAILALHLVRPRRRTVTVPETGLWHAALRERQRGMGLKKLMRNLSLLLLLLFALVAALVLSGPRWLTRSTIAGDTVLVLDVSASMQTRDGAGTRFQRALEVARDVIDSLPAHARALLMTSGRRALLRTGFERDPGVLRRALAGIEAGDESGQPREALQLALALLRQSDRGRVIFVTDGAFDAAIDPGSPRVEYRQVGAPARNVAITGFDFRPEVGREDRFQVLLTVRNYDAAPVTAGVSLSLERRQLLVRELSLPAAGEETLVLPFTGRATGRATARIDVDDDLAADNAAFAVVDVPPPRQVLLVSGGNFYLESVFGALPNVATTQVPALDAAGLALAARRHDVVVFDRVPAPALIAGRYLLLDTVPPGLPFAETGTVEAPAIQGQGASALMRDVDVSGVRIERARRVTVRGRPDGLQRLFWSAETPLALALLDGDVRAVYLGFDLARSSLPLNAAFPLFIAQSLDWLQPRTAASGGTQIAAGEPLLIRAPGAHTDTDLVMRTPSGDGETYRLDDGVLRYDATALAGIYRYSIDQVVHYFAVNLTDALESRINPVSALPAPAPETDAPPADAQATIPLWPPLTLLALVLLLAEWLLWWGRPRGA